jgi:hypothetical protein
MATKAHRGNVFGRYSLFILSILILGALIGLLIWSLFSKRQLERFVSNLSRTKDPKVFGPIGWTNLHIMAAHYPPRPDINYVRQCANYVRAIPYMLPCKDCGKHFQEFLDGYLEKNPNAFASRDELVKFFVEAHNNVNKWTNKKLWSIPEAEQKYGQIEGCFEKES